MTSLKHSDPLCLLGFLVTCAVFVFRSFPPARTASTGASKHCLLPRFSISKHAFAGLLSFFNKNISRIFAAFTVNFSFCASAHKVFCCCGARTLLFLQLVALTFPAILGEFRTSSISLSVFRCCPATAVLAVAARAATAVKTATERVRADPQKGEVCKQKAKAVKAPRTSSTAGRNEKKKSKESPVVPFYHHHRVCGMLSLTLLVFYYCIHHVCREECPSSFGSPISVSLSVIAPAALSLTTSKAALSVAPACLIAAAAGGPLGILRFAAADDDAVAAPTTVRNSSSADNSSKEVVDGAWIDSLNVPFINSGGSSETESSDEADDDLSAEGDSASSHNFVSEFVRTAFRMQQQEEELQAKKSAAAAPLVEEEDDDNASARKASSHALLLSAEEPAVTVADEEEKHISNEEDAVAESMAEFKEFGDSVEDEFILESGQHSSQEVSRRELVTKLFKALEEEEADVHHHQQQQQQWQQQRANFSETGDGSEEASSQQKGVETFFEEVEDEEGVEQAQLHSGPNEESTEQQQQQLRSSMEQTAEEQGKHPHQATPPTAGTEQHSENSWGEEQSEKEEATTTQQSSLMDEREAQLPQSQKTEATQEEEKTEEQRKDHGEKQRTTDFEEPQQQHENETQEHSEEEQKNMLEQQQQTRAEPQQQESRGGDVAETAGFSSGLRRRRLLAGSSSSSSNWSPISRHSHFPLFTFPFLSRGNGFIGRQSKHTRVDDCNSLEVFLVSNLPSDLSTRFPAFADREQAEGHGLPLLHHVTLDSSSSSSSSVSPQPMQDLKQQILTGGSDNPRLVIEQSKVTPLWNLRNPTNRDGLPVIRVAEGAATIFRLSAPVTGFTDVLSTIFEMPVMGVEIHADLSLALSYRLTAAEGRMQHHIHMDARHRPIADLDLQYLQCRENLADELEVGAAAAAAHGLLVNVTVWLHECSPVSFYWKVVCAGNDKHLQEPAKGLHVGTPERAEVALGVNAETLFSTESSVYKGVAKELLDLMVKREGDLAADGQSNSIAADVRYPQRIVAKDKNFLNFFIWCKGCKSNGLDMLLPTVAADLDVVMPVLRHYPPEESLAANAKDEADPHIISQQHLVVQNGKESEQQKYIHRFKLEFTCRAEGSSIIALEILFHGARPLQLFLEKNCAGREGGAATDPTCATGIPSFDGTICCAAHCGRCILSNCADHPDSKHCCMTRILGTALPCAISEPPCLMRPVKNERENAEDSRQQQQTQKQQRVSFFTLPLSFAEHTGSVLSLLLRSGVHALLLLFYGVFLVVAALYLYTVCRLLLVQHMQLKTALFPSVYELLGSACLWGGFLRQVYLCKRFMLLWRRRGGDSGCWGQPHAYDALDSTAASTAVVISELAVVCKPLKKPPPRETALFTATTTTTTMTSPAEKPINPAAAAILKVGVDEETAAVSTPLRAESSHRLPLFDVENGAPSYIHHHNSNGSGGGSGPLENSSSRLVSSCPATKTKTEKTRESFFWLSPQMSAAPDDDEEEEALLCNNIQQQKKQQSTPFFPPPTTTTPVPPCSAALLDCSGTRQKKQQQPQSQNDYYEYNHSSYHHHLHHHQDDYQTQQKTHQQQPLPLLSHHHDYQPSQPHQTVPLNEEADNKDSSQNTTTRPPPPFFKAPTTDTTTTETTITLPTRKNNSTSSTSRRLLLQPLQKYLPVQGQQEQQQERFQQQQREARKGAAVRAEDDGPFSVASVLTSQDWQLHPQKEQPLEEINQDKQLFFASSSTTSSTDSQQLLKKGENLASSRRLSFGSPHQPSAELHHQQKSPTHPTQHLHQQIHQQEEATRLEGGVNALQSQVLQANGQHLQARQQLSLQDASSHFADQSLNQQEAFWLATPEPQKNAKEALQQQQTQWQQSSCDDEGIQGTTEKHLDSSSASARAQQTDSNAAHLAAEGQQQLLQQQLPRRPLFSDHSFFF